MIDLSSPQMQRSFKSMRKLNFMLYVVLALLLISAVGLNFVSVSASGVGGKGLNWAQIVYIVLLAVLVLIVLVYFVIILYWILRAKGPYQSALNAFVEEGFAACPQVLEGGIAQIELEIYLIGDRITVVRQGCEQIAYFDLAPIKKYESVCAGMCKRVKKYVIAYYEENYERRGLYSVTLTDAINKKPRVIRIIEDGAPAKNKKKK